MEKNDKLLIRFLALGIFIASSCAAFSFGALAYTFVTGELPFGLVSHVESVQQTIRVAEDQKKAAAEEKHTDMRNQEAYIAALFSGLDQERAKISAERAKVEEEKKNVELLMNQATALQNEFKTKTEELQDLLKQIEDADTNNLLVMQKKLAGMPLAKAVQTLMTMDDVQASKLLYSMNKELSFKIIAECMKNPKEKEKIMKIQTLMKGMKEAKGKKKK